MCVDWKKWHGYFYLYIYKVWIIIFRGKIVTRNTIHMCCKFNLAKYWLPNCFLLATIMYVIYVGDFLSSWWIYDINIFCRIILSKTKYSLLYIFFYYIAAFVLEHMVLLCLFSNHAVNSYCMKCRYLYFRIMHSFSG